MTNINWITFKKPTDSKRLKSDLLKIAARRFNDDWSLVEQGSNYWEFRSDAHGGVSISLDDPKKVAFKAGADPQSEFAEYVFRNELGKLYYGMCGGEHDEDARWKPDPDRFPDFASYVKVVYKSDNW